MMNVINLFKNQIEISVKFVIIYGDWKMTIKYVMKKQNAVMIKQ